MGLPLSESRVSERAARLHREALVVDLHADTPTEFFLDPSYDFGARHEDGHVDLPRLREGGVDAEFMIDWVPAELAAEPGASGAHAMRLVEAVHAVAARTPGTRLATSAAEIEAARASGDVALLLGVEGGHALENSLEMLGRFHAAGVRYVTLTWNNANDWADACCSPPRHGGLTEFGREVIREMNRLGMLVDVSHAADTTVAQVLEVSEAPILASHSCARALAGLPRNLSDEQAREIARRGGVIGVNFFPAFLDEDYGARFDSLTKEMERRADAAYAAHGDRERARREANAWLRTQLAALEPVPLDRLLDHVDHLVRVAGADHVALGSDFDGILTLPAGIRDASDMPRITEGMLARGYSEDDVVKILGLNVLRLLREVTG
jgi:membrane dipeptidase